MWSTYGYETSWLAPQTVTVGRLTGYLGHADLGGADGRFPETGAVYILRKNPDDLDDNELVRATRERLIPHTYSLTARFGSSALHSTDEVNLRDSPQFSELFRWVAAFAGTPDAAEPPTGQPVDVSSLLLDAIAPPRASHAMHTNEKRQVNELLVQLDRIADRGVILVATTNYLRGIDDAIQRSGRFDMKLPIFPPTEADRSALFDYDLTPPRLRGFVGGDQIDVATLATMTPFFNPADIRAVIQATARQSIFCNGATSTPALTTADLIATVRQHTRSIRQDQAHNWLAEAKADLGSGDERIDWLRDEIERAFGRNTP